MTGHVSAEPQVNFARTHNGRRWRICVYKTMRGWAGFVEGGPGNAALCSFDGVEHATRVRALRSASRLYHARRDET